MSYKPKPCPHIDECTQCISEKEFRDLCMDSNMFDEDEFSREDCFKFFESGQPVKKQTPQEWKNKP